jgi:lactate dehydrogenase-like 2-hydroxyacid dehydrogenase
VIASCAVADAVIPAYAPLTARVLGELEHCRLAAFMSTGFNSVDLAAATELGIVVTHVPDYCTPEVADHTLGLLLDLGRGITRLHDTVKAGAWDYEAAGKPGRLSDQSLGIVGLGRIGRLTARRARGFDMTIHYHDVRRLPPDQEEGAIYHPTPETLMPHCDFLTFHCVASRETRKLLNAARIALLPDGAIVVNASRGTVIDDDALIAALRSGKVAAAGLDVYNNEPDIHPAYRELPNTFLMPHIGTATRETRDAMGFRALDNLDAFFAGREPRDRVA